MPSRSLFARTFSPVPKYNNRQKRIATAQKSHKSVSFCPFSLEYWKYFHIHCGDEVDVGAARAAEGVGTKNGDEAYESASSPNDGC
jgi:hypothetical protein